MARIFIHDLPQDSTISREELQRIRGGEITPYLVVPNYDSQYPVMFNPEKITINKSIEWKDQKDDYSVK